MNPSMNVFYIYYHDLPNECLVAFFKHVEKTAKLCTILEFQQINFFLKVTALIVAKMLETWSYDVH